MYENSIATKRNQKARVGQETRKTALCWRNSLCKPACILWIILEKQYYLITYKFILYSIFQLIIYELGFLNIAFKENYTNMDISLGLTRTNLSNCFALYFIVGLYVLRYGLGTMGRIHAAVLS